MKTSLLLAIALVMSSSAHAARPLPPPPDVAQRPHTVKAPHGAERQDPYYWLRDDKREAKEMLDYLKAENAYADVVMAPLKPVENAIYDEIVDRIKQDDSTVPFRRRGWWTYVRFETGKDYPIYARRKDAAGLSATSIQAANDAGDFSGEQVLLNVNTLAEGKDYYQAFPAAISQDNRLMVWGEDTNGRRQYTLRFRDLDKGEALPDVLTGTSGDVVWADDGRSVLYVENDPDTLLTKRVKRHVLGTDAKPNTVVY